MRLLLHEPIHADIQSLHDRNRKVKRIAEIAREARLEAYRVAADIAASRGLPWPPTTQSLHRWRWEVPIAQAQLWDPAYPGYVALKARRAAGVLSAAVSSTLNFRYHSREAHFVREAVRAWADWRGYSKPPRFVQEKGAYALQEGQLRLLVALDLPFRHRRLRDLVNTANAEYDREPEAGVTPDSHRSQIDRFKATLAKARDSLDRVDGMLSEDVYSDLMKLVRRVGAGASIHSLPDRERANLLEVLDAAYDMTADLFGPPCEHVNALIVGAIASIPQERVQSRIASAYAVFPFLDRITFPLMDTAGIEDLIEIDVMRISPADCEFQIGDDHQLKGAALGGFAGFHQRSFREHDLLWGRVHAVERLVDLIVRAAVQDDAEYEQLASLRATFKQAAVRAVLAGEENRPDTSVGAIVAEIQEQLPP